MNDGNKMPVTLELQESLLCNAIDRMAGPGDTFARVKMAGVQQAADPPTEAWPRLLEARMVQQSEHLLVADEPGVAHLAQQRNVAPQADYDAIFGVAQGGLRQFRGRPKPAAKLRHWLSHRTVAVAKVPDWYAPSLRPSSATWLPAVRAVG